MEYEEYLVEILVDAKVIKEAKLIVYDEGPENMDYKVELLLDQEVIQATGADFFASLQALRIQLESKGMQLLCNGAAENVYPSPMQMDMGNTRIAYRLQLESPARMCDLVSIFQKDENLHFVSVEKQKEFYSKWLSSRHKL